MGFVGWVGGGMENCIPINLTTILGCAGGVKMLANCSNIAQILYKSYKYSLSQTGQ